MFYRPTAAMEQFPALILGPLGHQWKIGNGELDEICFSKHTVGSPLGWLGKEPWWLRPGVDGWLIEKWTLSRSILGEGWAGFDDKVNTLWERSRAICWNGKRGFWFEGFERVRTFWFSLGSLKAEVEISLLIPASVWVILTSLRQDSLGFA